MSDRSSRRDPDLSADGEFDELIDELVETQLAENYDRLEGILEDYRSAARESDQASHGLRRRIMEIAEIEAARGPTVRLRTRSRQEFGIAAAAVRAVIRDAVDAMDGLVARRVSVWVDAEAGSSRAVDLRVSFAMRRGMALAGFEHDLRQRIARELEESVGIGLGRLELVLEDLEEGTGEHDRRG